jgi:hypothetical protein
MVFWRTAVASTSLLAKLCFNIAYPVCACPDAFCRGAPCCRLSGAGYHHRTFPIPIRRLLCFHTLSTYMDFLKCLENPLHFRCIDRVIVDKTNKGIFFCESILLDLQHHRTPHLYEPAYLVGCANNWEYIIALDT